MPRVPRYSREPFPAYRFVPGEHPHPTRDPAGHSFGRPEAVVPPSPETWRPACYAGPWEVPEQRAAGNHGPASTTRRSGRR